MQGAAVYRGTESEVSTPAEDARLVTLLEYITMIALAAVYCVSFGIESPVNGLGEIHELFDQDSRYILQSLAANVPYEWNAQNHVFYHWLTGEGFRLWQHPFGGGTDSAFLFLKSFTAATGLWFLVTLRIFLREVGLSGLERLVILLLAGLSMSVWFHFSAFETAGLTMPLCLLFFIAFLRRVRRQDESMANHLLLIGSLLFAFWTRSDQWRLPVAMALSLLLPQARGRGLFLDLVAFGALLPVGYCLLASSYFHVPLMQAVRKLAERHDRPELAPLLMTRANLTTRDLLRVWRANAFYSHLMPVGEPLSPFSSKLTGLLHSPLSLLALVGVGAGLFTTSVRSLQRLVRGDPFHLLLWASWIMGWLFYTWFNPREPFLWILQFGVLQIVALADSWPKGKKWPLVALVGVTMLVATHNTVFFWHRYQ
jgi:hypothetical protein